MMSDTVHAQGEGTERQRSVAHSRESLGALERVAVVVPCKNEAESLALLLPQLNAVISSLERPMALYVVDGHSTDATREVAARHHVTLIPQRGQGYGGAIKTALDTIDADWIITLDADCSHPPPTLK